MIWVDNDSVGDPDHRDGAVPELSPNDESDFDCTARCTSSHHGRFVAAFTSPVEARTPPPTIALASSAPSHVGRCSLHQHTVRISWTGSRSGSQRGQYDDARLGGSVRSPAREPADDECTPPYRS